MLIVDDDEDWRSVIADVLSEEGFSVNTASDGRAACVSFRLARPAVVVTDVDMPVMTGRELLAWLRSRDRSLPVIVMTGEDELVIASECPGAFRVLRKPATTDAIVSAVREASLLRDERLVGKIARAAKALADSARRCSTVSRRSRRGRVRFAMATGVGVTALAALAIVAIRGVLA